MAFIEANKIIFLEGEYDFKFALEDKIKSKIQNDTETVMCFMQSYLTIGFQKYIFRNEYKISRKNEGCGSSLTKHSSNRLQHMRCVIPAMCHLTRVLHYKNVFQAYDASYV